MIRTLLIVDDHEIFRAGLSALIGSALPDVTILQAPHAAAALPQLAEHEPDVVILDYEMPGTNGLELLRQLRPAWPDMRIIMMTAMHSGILVRELVDLGADAVLTKRGSGDELLDLLLTDSAASPQVSEAFADDLSRTRPLAALTRREQETLEHLIAGLSTAQIGDAMGVSFKAAESHRTRIMAKLDVHSYAELLKKIRDMGWIPPTL